MFRKVTDHIYIRKYQHYTDRPNIGYIRGERAALLFDAGNSGANVQLLKEELREAGLSMPDFVALSHWHWDHSFGAPYWMPRSSQAGKRMNGCGKWQSGPGTMKRWLPGWKAGRISNSAPP